MKRIIASACLILTFVFGLSALVKAQRRDPPQSGNKKHRTANHPPKITSFQSSAGTVTIPCPWWDAPNAMSCVPSPRHDVTLTTEASDSDGDTLQYEYAVTGGQIIGKGSSVDWDFYQLKPGSYTVTVAVSDQHGGIASASINIVVVLCQCDHFCPTVSIECPIDAEEGQPMTLSVNVSGGEPKVNLTYKWTVSAGTIIAGQGTPTIAVDTKGLGEKQIKATIEIGGFPPECDRERSCIVLINKKAEKQKQ